MTITTFQLHDGRLIYGDSNFTCFEPLPRFTINRNANMLLLTVGNDNEISIHLEAVMLFLGLESFEDTLTFFCENYILSGSNVERLPVTNEFVTAEDELIVSESLANFKTNIIF